MISEHDIEEWKPVQLEGYEKYYEISSFGSVRSLRRDRLLKPWKAARMQYWAVALHGDGISTKQYIHRLVLLTFVGPCPEGMESCHGEKGKDVNRLDNLRWGTRLSNAHDIDLHGNRLLGDEHPTSILTETDVAAIKTFCKNRGDRTTMARKYNVSTGTINDIMQGKTWAHVRVQTSELPPIGVDFRKKNKKWRARICVDWKSIYIGEYDSRDEAIAAREAAVVKYRR